MCTIAVFFDKPGFDEYPFSIELYRTVYRQLGEKLEKLGAQLCIVRGQESFVRGNTFTHAWKFDGTWFQYVDEPTTVDLIWNKGFFRSDPDTRVINDPELDAIATDKWKACQLFNREHAPTRCICNLEDWNRASAELRTETVVVKPLEGWGGEGVIITSRMALPSTPPELPCILQEFIDTSGGIPGLVDGMHDLRIIMLGGEIGLCYIRTPPSGEKTANVSRGGREIEVLPAHIPPGAVQLARTIDAALTRFPSRIYTIDMGLGSDGQWHVFELNSKPGFSPMETGASYGVFYVKLAEFLLKIAQNAL